jgi:hypothetical protein
VSALFSDGGSQSTLPTESGGENNADDAGPVDHYSADESDNEDAGDDAGAFPEWYGVYVEAPEPDAEAVWDMWERQWLSREIFGDGSDSDDDDEYDAGDEAEVSDEEDVADEETTVEVERIVAGGMTMLVERGDEEIIYRPQGMSRDEIIVLYVVLVIYRLIQGDDEPLHLHLSG